MIHKEGQNGEFGPLGRTKYLKLAHKEEGNIRIWSTRKDRNLELVHKEGQRTFETDPQNIEFDPQGEGRTSESGQVRL